MFYLWVTKLADGLFGWTELASAEYHYFISRNEANLRTKTYFVAGARRTRCFLRKCETIRRDCLVVFFFPLFPRFPMHKISSRVVRESSALARNTCRISGPSLHQSFLSATCIKLPRPRGPERLRKELRKEIEFVSRDLHVLPIMLGP